MAMVLDAFVGFLLERLGNLAAEEVTKILGAERELKVLQKNLIGLRPFLSDAESKKITTESVRVWLAELRDHMYDADDILDDWRAGDDAYANAEESLSARVSSSAAPSRWFSCCLSWSRSVPLRHNVGTRIRELNSSLEISNSRIPMLQLVESLPHSSSRSSQRPSRPGTGPVMVDEDIVGIDGVARSMVDLLTGAIDQGRKCPVYAITGMAGIGKTTLAKKIFNDAQVKSHFEVTMWMCISSEYEELDLLKQIIRFVTNKDNNRPRSHGEVYGDANTKAELEPIVQRMVKGKRFLLVLDDIWDHHVWSGLLRTPLRNAADDSRVLITTKNNKIALDVGSVYTHHVKVMTDKDAWLMLRKVAFDEDWDESWVTNFKTKGMEIVKKCKGLPLAIKTVGGTLKSKRTWKEWDEVSSSHIWALTELPNDIKPGFLLSYDDLPSHLKQCFIYCSLFPEDFTFHQPSLVQMWIAEGLVEEKKDVAMEELAEDYYRELMTRNLLQASPDYYDGLGSSMHALVRSFAHHVSLNEHIYDVSDALNDASTKRRHLSFVKKDATTVPDITVMNESLRTLLLSRNPLVKSIPPELFQKLKRLRVLDLAYTGITSLPDTLGNLIHLRFLNVSYTKLKALPESIQSLRNLETFNAKGSKYLRELCVGITMLQNLRHLTVGSNSKNMQLDHLPGGMRNLKNLRTLAGFVVNDGTKTVPNMKELMNLSSLTHLSVYRMERVASKAEAEQATMGTKKSLRYLRLSCTRKSRDPQHEEGEIKRIEDAFEGIDPPRSLDAFHIEGYYGQEWPSSIASCSFNVLTWLRLDDCRMVTQLPPLGKLPELRVLQIWGATAVTMLGPEFFGGPSGFPKLDSLYIWGMTKLQRISSPEKGAFARLKRFHVIKCPRLKSFPNAMQHAKNLAQLTVEGSDNIDFIGNLPSLSELNVEGNPRLTMVSNLPALSNMTIRDCPALKNVIDVRNLYDLFLSDESLEVLPHWVAEQPALRKLNMRGRTRLVSRCCRGGADWPLIKKILRVEVRSVHGPCYMFYSKVPRSFESHVTDNDDASSSSSPPGKTPGNVTDEEDVSPFVSPYEY